MARDKKVILIVDDEFSIVETLDEILSWAGYEVRSASNGRLALEEARASLPDLIIVDYMMPVMDGVQMVSALRLEPAIAQVKVVLMTAAPLRAAAFEPKWDALLAKPFDVKTLLRAIEDLLLTPPLS